jgi:polar amino acid transport system substrate-binding protein
MKKIVIAAMLAASALGIAFAGGSKEAAGQNKSASVTLKPGVLAVGMAENYPPFEYKDTDGTTPIGFDVDFTKALADKLGLKVS